MGEGMPDGMMGRGADEVMQQVKQLCTWAPGLVKPTGDDLFDNG